jgi:hypothetical protein
VKVKELKNGRVHFPSQRVWDSIVAKEKDHLFEVLEYDHEVKPVAVKGEKELVQSLSEKKKTGPKPKQKNG